MKSSAISCPNCGHQFELSDVMTRDIENQLKAKFEKDLQQVREKIKEEEEKKAAQKMMLELTDLKVTLAEREEKLEEANKAQLALMKEKRQLEDAKKEMAFCSALTAWVKSRHSAYAAAKTSYCGASSNC